MIEENKSSSYPNSKFFNPSVVSAKRQAKDWVEASQIVGEILVDYGGIEPRYIDAMRRVLKEIGPYAVIAPGIVLLHARPEDGVIFPCFGLVTLSTPVNFGHSENDPVDIVLGFGAKDKHSHINGLKFIAELLSDPDELENLRKAKDDHELFSVIQKWAEENYPNLDETLLKGA